jgi:hypothetical protein
MTYTDAGHVRLLQTHVIIKILEDLRRTIQSQGLYFRYECKGEMDIEKAISDQLLSETRLKAWLDQTTELFKDYSTTAATHPTATSTSSSTEEMNAIPKEESGLHSLAEEQTSLERKAVIPQISSVGIIFLGDLNSTPETAAIEYINR